MRVLQLIDSLQVGGAERTAVNFANLLTNKIDKSYLCVTRKEGQLNNAIKKDVVYLFLSKKKSLDFLATKKLSRFLKANNISIIHAHSTSYFFATIIKCFNPKIKIIWHDHHGNRVLSNKLNNAVLKLCSYFFSKIIVVNFQLKLWAEENLASKKVYYLPNFSVFNNDDKITDLKGIKGKRIVYLANFRTPKNHMFLLNVFLNINRSANDWSLHLIGENFSDQYFEQIKKYINNNNLEEQVYIYGLRQDIKYILSQSSIGVLSSSSEGLPLSLIEYGLAKLPVVSTNVGDCNKVITQPSEGILVNSEDLISFSKALLKYINNESLRKEHGEILYKKVITNFDANTVIKQLLLIYSN